LPAIIYYTGGGWVNGDVADEIPTAAWFRDHGMIGITADYRVKKQARIPPPMESYPGRPVGHALHPVATLKNWASILNKIVAAGGSAGGHLAICTLLRWGR
jgi:acetyl esterase